MSELKDTDLQVESTKPTPEHAKPVDFKKKVELDPTKAGTIYEVSLNRKSFRSADEIPEVFLKQLLDTERLGKLKRHAITRKMFRNSPNRFPLIGKPTSAFLFLNLKGKFKLHYLLELEDFDRKEQLHAILKAFDEKTGRKNYLRESLLGGNSLFSGHLASITKKYRNESYGYVYYFDRFSGENPKLNLLERRTISVLHANGILPITTDGYPIFSPSQRSERL